MVPAHEVAEAVARIKKYHREENDRLREELAHLHTRLEEASLKAVWVTCAREMTEYAALERLEAEHATAPVTTAADPGVDQDDDPSPLPVLNNAGQPITALSLREFEAVCRAACRPGHEGDKVAARLLVQRVFRPAEALARERAAVRSDAPDRDPRMGGYSSRLVRLLKSRGVMTGYLPHVRYVDIATASG